MNDITSSTYLDFNALTQLKGDAARDPRQAIRKTAEQFEAYFIQQMMKTMRESIEKSDLVDSGNMEMYQDLMDKEVSLSMAKRGGMGLADMLERQMHQAQALSTQDALQMRQPASAPHLPLKPTRDPMSLKPAAIEAYQLERHDGFKLKGRP
ncbi:MAG: rod-binding protein [Limnohabitans sp.]|jgi:Rod binding domain-containing protein|uniref:rod-binding protein n=1 Tax=Limnohabitans sp. TaxID=1907725 RepID=UPI00391BC503